MKSSLYYTYRGINKNHMCSKEYNSIHFKLSFGTAIKERLLISRMNGPHSKEWNITVPLNIDFFFVYSECCLTGFDFFQIENLLD